MSGGVDSSAAAMLLKDQGWRVMGVTMRLMMDEEESAFDPSLATSRSCCTLTDALDAKEVASRLDFDHQVHNFSLVFKTEVIDRFISSYFSGRTPNPCIDCNRRLKFTHLYRRAELLGLNYLATGHYARTQFDPETGRYLLLKAVDLHKDQSYVLYGLTQDELSRTLFPLGNTLKTEVRSIAKSAGLVNALKPDSQDLCFVRDSDYTHFLETHGPTPIPGDIIDSQGRVLGRHKGIHRYTIGQRKGLGVCWKEPLYVIALDSAKNTVTVGLKSELYAIGALVTDLNLISIASLTGPMEVQAKIRYRQPEVPAIIEPAGSGILLKFKSPQTAVAPGQAAVFYQGEIVVGGGTIESPVF
ncbi:MAG: tRNA 2-thiouridine(34) synthase MnmA [Deltaproteobacteria bacterium]|jgi:tRNA-specific 2-thiouridylase|nr:tRNA 2-thiouridine(34) synthase MnmA [Deltaproteobacteria bacterium]